jgi:hypothetical protein
VYNRTRARYFSRQLFDALDELGAVGVGVRRGIVRRDHSDHVVGRILHEPELVGRPVRSTGDVIERLDPILEPVNAFACLIALVAVGHPERHNKDGISTEALEERLILVEGLGSPRHPACERVIKAHARHGQGRQNHEPDDECHPQHVARHDDTPA